MLWAVNLIEQRQITKPQGLPLDNRVLQALQATLSTWPKPIPELVTKSNVAVLEVNEVWYIGMSRILDTHIPRTTAYPAIFNWVSGHAEPNALRELGIARGKNQAGFMIVTHEPCMSCIKNNFDEGNVVEAFREISLNSLEIRYVLFSRREPHIPNPFKLVRSTL